MLFTMNSIEPLTISPPNKLTSGKNKHFRISLGAKFIGLVVIIILAITGVVGYINIKAEQSLLLKNLIANGESLGKFAALISPEAILSYGFVDLSSYVEAITKNKDVIYGVFMSPEGEPMTSFVRHQEGRLNPPEPLNATQLEAMFTPQGELLTLSFLIHFDDNVIATLTLGLSKNSVTKASDRIIKGHLTQLAWILPLLIGTLYIAFRSLAISPITRLVSALEGVGKEQVKEVEILFHDEIGDLGKSFNRMNHRLNRLQTANEEANNKLFLKAQELERLNNNLEYLVSKRTHDLEQKAQKLKRSNEELDKFAYVASHDLKSPLRAITSLSEWIEEDLEGKIDEKIRKNLTLLRSRAHRLDALIDGILRYSRAGRIAMDIESVDVNTLVAEVVDSLNPPPEFQFNIAPNLPTLKTARVPLFQIFSNLMSNAIKHHDRKDGRISVTVQEIILKTTKNNTKEFYEFTVADDGPGIDDKYYDKVFLIFQTLKSRDEHESTGIGLALIKRIISDLGGEISITPSQGRGVEFRFSLPKQPDHD